MVSDSESAGTIFDEPINSQTILETAVTSNEDGNKCMPQQVKEVASSNNHHIGKFRFGEIQANKILEVANSGLTNISYEVQVKPVTIEVCCGCARMSYELRQEGFETIAVDWKGNKDTTEVPCLWIDLSSDYGQKEFWDLLVKHKNRLKLVWMGPPCGTATRAREIRVTTPNENGEIIDPKPLRSDDHPDGLPDLGGKAKENVDKANTIYWFCVKVALWCDEMNVAWVIENPRNSHMWETKGFRRLRDLKWKAKLKRAYARYYFHNCMHGGPRPKRSALLAAGIDLSDMELECDGKHQHRPWGWHKRIKGWATSEERNYPRLMCKRVALLSAKQLKKLQKKPNPGVAEERVAANKQPRKGMAELIPEFKPPIGQSEEYGTIVGAIPVAEGEKSSDKATIGINLMSTENPKDVDGVKWNPAEFVEQAKKLTHPFDKPVKLAPSTASAMLAIATLGPTEVKRLRNESIAWYARRKADLKEEEAKLHASLPINTEKVVKDKHILLFQEMLNDIGYDDMSVVFLLTLGTKIVGLLSRVGIWRPCDQSPKCSTGAVLAGAELAKAKLRKEDTRHNGDDKVTKAVLEATKDDIEAGVLEGPYSELELDAILGSKAWVPARRFGITQGKKVRPIDDFSENGHNSAFGVEEKISLKSIDTVVATAKAWLSCVDDEGKIELHDSSGKILRGWLHPDWTMCGWKDLVGRVADLKSAYKQLPVHSAHAHFNVVAVRNAAGKCEFYKALSLMFGETAAVYSFLRISRALQAIASKLFWLIAVEFFDDFSQIEAAVMAASGQSTLENLFKLLGWKISEGDKRLPFAKRFVSLGVQVNFCSEVDEYIELENKEGRVDGIEEMMKPYLEKQKVFGFREALSVRGKMSFAEGQTFSRVLAPVARMLSMWVKSGERSYLSQELTLGISRGISHLRSARPKRINPRRCMKPPVLVFTDGACEDAGTSVGGLIIDGDLIEHFGFWVDKEKLEKWKTKEDQKQVIGQAELYPLLVARLTWGKYLKGRRVIYFIDNESARIGLVRGYSSVLPSLKIIMQCLEWDCNNDSTAWFARVPSESNPADGPSRMEPQWVESALRSVSVTPVLPPEAEFAILS